MPFNLQGLVEGVTSAASPEMARENEAKRADRRATSHEELQAKTKMIMDNAKGVQDKIAALGDNPDPAKVAPYRAELHKLMQDFQDLYHPQKNPQHLPMLGRVLRSLRGDQPQQAMTVDQMVQGTIAGAGRSQDEYAGFSPQDRTKAQRIKAGLEPRAGTEPADTYQIVQVVDAKGRTRTIKQNTHDPSDVRNLAGEPIPPEELRGMVKKETTHENRDDKYIAILAKEKSKQPLSQDEKDYKGAYDLWVKETKVDPGVARAAAFGPNRYVPIIDPQNPENVTFMRVGDAAKAHVLSPQSISFQIDKAITKYFTSGPAATTINYFNTAIDHLKLLAQTAEALQNGDIPAFNKAANAFASATGSPAPSNFDTVRNAVAGELAKTFKGTGATDEEIGLISSTTNNAQSPDQLAGAIDYDLRLMDGKMQALKGQYEAGKEGKPNFPGGAKGAPEGGKPFSLKKAMALPFNKGKSEAEVKKDLETHGYQVTP